MHAQCQEIQESVVASEGRLDLLSESERSHVAGCSECARRAAEERTLTDLLAQAVPPADPKIERRVLAAVRARQARRRLTALLPVAASLLLAMAGVLLVGGVPGASLLALLPTWSGHGWMALLGAARDWGVIATTSVEIAGSAMSPAVVAGAAFLSIAVLVVLLLVARRWRRQVSWVRER